MMSSARGDLLSMSYLSGASCLLPSRVNEQLASLTPAERLVAVHLVAGLSNKEIAALLCKAEPTVKHQVSSILRTANVQSRCQFIAFYYHQSFASLLKGSPIGEFRWDLRQ